MFVLFLSPYKFCVCVCVCGQVGEHYSSKVLLNRRANPSRTCVCLSWSVYRNVPICPGSAQSLSLFAGQRLMAFLQTAQRECNSQLFEGNALWRSLSHIHGS